MTPTPLQLFPSLAHVEALCHGFITRIPGVPVDTHREEALHRLEAAHRAALQEAGAGQMPLVTVGQVHGDRVVIADPRGPWSTVGDLGDSADGLATAVPGLCLGIYVADCAPVYLVDPVRRAIALLHSGKKGSALGIVRRGLRLLTVAYGSRPADILVQIGPCIRPPHYEIDFAQSIREEARQAGAQVVLDCGDDTAAEPQCYYSYRMEKGRTGRMLAFLALLP